MARSCRLMALGTRVRLGSVLARDMGLAIVFKERHHHIPFRVCPRPREAACGGPFINMDPDDFSRCEPCHTTTSFISVDEQTHLSASLWQFSMTPNARDLSCSLT